VEFAVRPSIARNVAGMTPADRGGDPSPPATQAGNALCSGNALRGVPYTNPTRGGSPIAIPARQIAVMRSETTAAV